MTNVQAKRSWKCPWCQQEYWIPVHKADPSACPECRKNKPKAAVSEQPAVQKPPVLNTRKPIPRISLRSAWSIFCVVFLGGILCLGGYAIISKGYQAVTSVFSEEAWKVDPKIAEKRRIEDKKIEAWTMAQQFVTDRLKSPSTADFGGIFLNQQSILDCVTPLPNNEYVVKGWVDSQNSFGATVRTNFFLKMRNSPHSEKWLLIGEPIMVQR